MERFFSLSHLTVERLRDLYQDAAGDDNYIVFHEDFEDWPDATTIAFPLKNHPYTTAYIDLDNTLLIRFAEKYRLAEWWQMEGSRRKHYPFGRFYTLEPMKRGDIN